MAGLAKDLIDRRVPQVVGAYVGGCLGVLYFVQYVVESFVLSPYWNRVAIVGLALILPSVVLLAYTHGRPGKDRWGLAERIGIPVNLVVVVIVLAALFGNADLGAATRVVTVQDEEGNTVERVVAKSEFRKRVALFPFDVGAGLERDGWMSVLTSIALWIDLSQDDFVDGVSVESFRGQLVEAGYGDLTGAPLSLMRDLAERQHTAHMVAGSLAATQAGVRLMVRLHEVASGRLENEWSYEGADLLALIDSASVDIKEGLRIPSREGILDLPLAEVLSTDPDAIEAYGRALEARIARVDYDGAIDFLLEATRADPSFAAAQNLLAATLIDNNRPQEALAPIQAALENVRRLPERMQFVVRSNYYFLFAGDAERAQAVVDMWVELHPDDPAALSNLMGVQQSRGDREGMLRTAERLYELSPDNGTLLLQVANLHEALGQYDEARDALVEYTERFPEDYNGYNNLAGHYLLRGELETARANFERAILLEPARVGLMVNLANLDLRLGNYTAARTGLERALAVASTPQERVSVWSGLRTYHYVRGEMPEAIAVSEHRLEDMGTYMPPYQALPDATDVIIYFGAGRGDEVARLVEAHASELQPPLDVFGGPPRVAVAVERGLADEAKRILSTTEQQIDALGLAGSSANGLLRARGRIAELTHDWETALEAYRSRLPLIQGSATATATGRRDVGRVLQHMGRLDEAEAETRATLELWPASAWAHQQLAEILVAKGRTAEAIPHIERAVADWEDASPTYEPPQRARSMLAELRR